jgi:hypothetical protein
MHTAYACTLKVSWYVEQHIYYVMFFCCCSCHISRTPPSDSFIFFLGWFFLSPFSPFAAGSLVSLSHCCPRRRKSNADVAGRPALLPAT